MEIIIFLLFIFMLIYIGYIARLIYGFTKVHQTESKYEIPQIKFSIIVPFREEQENLPRLLESIRLLNYPIEMFEIVLIDDFSADNSVNVINRWRMQNGLFQTTIIENLLLSGSPKKDAISRALPVVANEWILTTDADCILPPHLLQSVNSFIQKNKVEMVVGAIRYDGNSSFLNHFQRMDIMSLQGATIGSFGIGKPFMCNGANFAYSKRFFSELNGFDGNSNLASGDDVFLLQKGVLKSLKKIGYNKSRDAIVITKPVETWNKMINQRIRWASKTNSYQSIYGEDLAFAVFLGNLVIVISLVLVSFQLMIWQYLAILFLIKFIPDFILLLQSNSFLNRRGFFPLFAAIFYPFFTVAIALMTISGNYKWKGRHFKM